MSQHAQQSTNRTGACTMIVIMAVITVGFSPITGRASAQSPSPEKTWSPTANTPTVYKDSNAVNNIKEHLIGSAQPDVFGIRYTRNSTMSEERKSALVAQAQMAETHHQFRVAADDVALAAAATGNFPQRDSLHRWLRDLIQKQRGGAPTAVLLDSLVGQTLDWAFQTVYDRFIPVTRASPATSGRVVIVEQITGTQCGFCWFHDRLYAGVRQRYPERDVVILEYHGGPGWPIAYGGDSLWERMVPITVADAKTSYVTDGFYPESQTPYSTGDFGWIDGKQEDPGWFGTRGQGDPDLWPQPMQDAFHQMYDSAPNLAAAMYAVVVPAIDRRLQQPPKAQIALTVTPIDGPKTRLRAARVRVRVTPAERRKRLGVRLVLVEDTVRVTGFTQRRLHYDAVRTVAWFGHPRQMYSLLPAERTTPTTLTYTFNIAALQQALLHTRASDEAARAAFPNPHDGWLMQPRRLSVVAIVQDIDTKEILQSAIQRILPSPL